MQKGYVCALENVCWLLCELAVCGVVYVCMLVMVDLCVTGTVSQVHLGVGMPHSSNAKSRAFVHTIEPSNNALFLHISTLESRA
mmetsp:Transcript_16580/g.38079  ORF Transcript_16580/g.38079 Transcript_16580/m.38079 type:complete len:84 (+) Transcript_16580:770-1021(+)